MGAWVDPVESDEEEDEATPSAGNEDEDGSSSGSSDSEDSESESSEHASRSRSAGEDPKQSNNKVSDTKPKTGKPKNLTGPVRQGQEVPDSRPRTSDTGTDQSRASGSSSSTPPHPLPHPILLRNLQAASGQEIGLGSIDLTNARVAITNNHLVIQTDTITGLPESWNPPPLPPRLPGHSAGAAPFRTRTERSRDTSNDNG